MAVIINEFEVVPAEESPPRQPAQAGTTHATQQTRPAPPTPLRAALRRRAERRERVRAH
jgi:hypothetical protein